MDDPNHGLFEFVYMHLGQFCTVVFQIYYASRSEFIRYFVESFKETLFLFSCLLKPVFSVLHSSCTVRLCYSVLRYNTSAVIAQTNYIAPDFPSKVTITCSYVHQCNHDCSFVMYCKIVTSQPRTVGLTGGQCLVHYGSRGIKPGQLSR